MVVHNKPQNNTETGSLHKIKYATTINSVWQKYFTQSYSVTHILTNLIVILLNGFRHSHHNLKFSVLEYHAHSQNDFCLSWLN